MAVLGRSRPNRPRYIEPVAAPAVLPKIDTLTDDFATQNTAKWTFVGSATATGGRLSVPGGTGGEAKSVNRYNLTESSATVELVQHAGYDYLELEGVPNNSVFWQVTGGGAVEGVRRVASVDTVHFTATYNNTTHRWLRIAVVAGVVTWYYSADGVNWTPAGTTWTSTIDLTSVSVAIGAATSGTGLWDNFNLAPTVVTVQAAATLAGVGGLTAGAVREQPAAVTLGGVGGLTAAATRIQPGAATLAGSGQLTAAGVQVLPAAASLAGAGSLTAAATVVSYDRTGWLYAGTATEISGTWIDEPNAVGPSTGDYATWTTTASGSAVLELAGFAAQAAVPGDNLGVGPVDVLVRHGEDTQVTSVTAQPYLAATPYGSAVALTVNPAVHEDTITVSGLTYADLADLRVQITATR